MSPVQEVIHFTGLDLLGSVVQGRTDPLPGRHVHHAVLERINSVGFGLHVVVPERHLGGSLVRVIGPLLLGLVVKLLERIDHVLDGLGRVAPQAGCPASHAPPPVQVVWHSVGHQRGEALEQALLLVLLDVASYLLDRLGDFRVRRQECLLEPVRHVGGSHPHVDATRHVSPQELGPAFKRPGLVRVVVQSGHLVLDRLRHQGSWPISQLGFLINMMSDFVDSQGDVGQLAFLDSHHLGTGRSSGLLREPLVDTVGSLTESTGSDRDVERTADGGHDVLGRHSGAGCIAWSPYVSAHWRGGRW